MKKSTIIVASVLIVLIVGVSAYNLWPNITLPVTVTEPIEILDYSPASLELFPGEFENISITVQNHASMNYSVILDFQLNDTGYQHSFIIFSENVYTIPNGVHTLHAWLKVEPNAYAADATLTINVQRVKEGEPPPTHADLFEEHFNNLAAWDIDLGSILVEINPPGQLHTFGGFVEHHMQFPTEFTIEFKLKVDTFGTDDWAVFQIYTSRSCRIFQILSDRIEMGTARVGVGFEEFSVSTDNGWHIWKLVVDENLQEAAVYRDGTLLTVFTRAEIRSDLVQRIYTGSRRGTSGGTTETHWDYVFISTGLQP